MIQPTVGRVVWYMPNEHDRVTLDASDQPLAAHVAYVHSDRLVNLMVIDANGRPHSRTSVTLAQDGDSVLGGSSYCIWMPYQKGQAAKTEALEAKALEAKATDPRLPPPDASGSYNSASSA